MIPSLQKSSRVSVSRVWKWRRNQRQTNEQKELVWWPIRASILLTEVPFSKLLNLYPPSRVVFRSWAWPLTSLWISLCLFFLMLWGSAECQALNAFAQHTERSWASYTFKNRYNKIKCDKKQGVKEDDNLEGVKLTNQESQCRISGNSVHTGWMYTINAL